MTYFKRANKLNQRQTKKLLKKLRAKVDFGHLGVNQAAYINLHDFVWLFGKDS